MSPTHRGRCATGRSRRKPSRGPETLIVGTAWLGFRFPRVRPILEGGPVIRVADGQVLERNLRRERMTVEELGAEARLSRIGSLDDVRYAVLESNGKVSFLTES